MNQDQAYNPFMDLQAQTGEPAHEIMMIMMAHRYKTCFVLSSIGMASFDPQHCEKGTVSPNLMLSVGSATLSEIT